MARLTDFHHQQQVKMLFYRVFLREHTYMSLLNVAV
jgi:hypothetical protein